MVVVMFVGVYFLTTEGKMIVPKVGDLLIIGAAMMWSAGAVTMRLLLRGNKVSGETATFVRSLITLPVVMFVVLVAPVLPSFAQGVFLVNPFEFGYLSYGLIRGALSAITLIFLNRSLKISSASYNTMMSMMVPVMVSVLALLFLGERVSVMQALGGGLIILSGVGTHYLRVYDD
jgi:drug/metabolite transporter (DMT)-like permease